MTTEVPKGWEERALQDVAQVVRGITFPSNAKRKQPGPGLVKCLRTSNVQRTLTFDDVLYVPIEYVKREAQWLMSGDTVISTANSSALVGKVAFATAAPEKTAIGGFISIIRPKAIDPRFLWYQLSSSQVQEQFKRSASQTVNISNLSLAGLLPTRLVAPPIEEQRRIVDTLDSYFSRLDDVEAGLERVQRNLKRYRASVLQAAVTGRLGSAIRSSPQHQTVEGVVSDSTLAELPEEWTWATIGAVSEVSGGLTKNARRAALKRSIPFLRVANVYANELRLDDVTKIGVEETELKRTLLVRGDLLVVEGNGSLEQIGRVAMWDGSISPCVHQNHLIKVRTADEGLRRWLLLWMLSPSGRQAIVEAAGSTSGLHTLSLSKVKNLRVAMPPAGERVGILAAVDSALSSLKNIAAEIDKQLRRATALRQSVLSRAFAGELSH